MGLISKGTNLCSQMRRKSPSDECTQSLCYGRCSKLLVHVLLTVHPRIQVRHNSENGIRLWLNPTRSPLGVAPELVGRG